MDTSEDPEPSIELSGNAPLQIFPFVDALHREVVLRHMDGESQDIEMTPDEADRVADLLKAAAAQARAVVVSMEEVEAAAAQIDAATTEAFSKV